MIPRPITLLMTATISPARGVATAVAASATRKAEYLRALTYYRGLLGKEIDRIVFVDNSASDLTAFAEIADGLPITLVSYEGLKYPPAYGYGYGEFALIEYAMRNVPQLEGLIVKVTGRYLVTNLGSVIRSAANVEFAGDIWNRRKPWLDLRVLMWTRTGYEELLTDCYLDLRDDVNKLPSEMILSRRILEPGPVRVRTYLSADPRILGKRGLDGKDWNGGRLAWKRRVRAAFRPLMLALRAYPGARREAATVSRHDPDELGRGEWHG